MNNFTFDSPLAKILFLVFAIIASNFNIVFGVIVILIYICLNQNIIENMEGTINSSKDSNVQKFKNNYCSSGILVKDNKQITPLQIKDSFPNIKFTGDTCNPCDEDCSFQIISSEEQLTNEDNLRAIDSNQINIDRNKAIIKK